MANEEMKRIGVITDEIDTDDTAMAIAVAKEMHLGFVDIRKIYGHSTRRLTDADVDQMKADCDKYEMPVGTICSAYGKCLAQDMLGEEQMGYLNKDIGTAKKLNAKIVRIFAGFYKGAADEEDIAAKNMETVVKIAEDNDIILALEHEPVTLTRRAAFTRRLIDEANSEKLKILYEPTNLFLAGDDVLAGWDLLKDYSIGVHVKDGYPVDRKKWADGGLVSEGWEWETLGDGETPWDELIKKIVDSGYKGTYSIELHCGPSAALVGVSVGRLKGYLGISNQ